MTSLHLDSSRLLLLVGGHHLFNLCYGLARVQALEEDRGRVSQAGRVRVVQ